MYFSRYFKSDIFLLFINIPYIIELFRKRKIILIIISILIILYYSCFYNLPVDLVVVEYIIYYVLFYYILKKERPYEFILNTFIFIKGIILSFEIIYILPNQTNYSQLITKVFFMLVTFYIGAKLVLKALEKAKEIISFNGVLKELEKEKLLKNALFKITHEIKNPIAVCKGYLSMMDYKDEKKVIKYNNIIKNEINRALDIMDDFSDYTKIKINPDFMDINYLIEDTIFSMTSLFEEQNIDISFKTNVEEIFIDGDFNRLKQVLVNILKNSVESMNKEKKWIKVNSKSFKDHVNITIEDNGIGINEENLKHVGELFYSNKDKGTGLGISLSMEVIKLHNGVMNYYSEEEQGTKVIIKLLKDKLKAK